MKLTSQQITSVFSHKNRAHIVVLGDPMLDHYVYGSAAKLSNEAPVPVVKWHEDVYVPGGAANVAMNASALGAKVAFFGFSGRDMESGHLSALLDGARIDTSGLFRAKGYATPVKARTVAGGHLVGRLDKDKDLFDVRSEDEEELCRQLKAYLHKHDSDNLGVIVSDYAKATITKNVMKVVNDWRASKSPWRFMAYAPKPENTRIGVQETSDPTVIIPNKAELLALAHIKKSDERRHPHIDGVLAKAVAKLATAYSPRNILVTLGAEGAMLYADLRYPYDNLKDKNTYYPAAVDGPVDVAGAGDTLMAAYAVAALAGADSKVAAEIANTAAGIVVRKHGTATVSAQELVKKLKTQK